MEFSDTLIKRLKASRRITVLTGAGFSAESGVPTFRDKGGIWEKYQPEDLASAEAFRKNPCQVLEWYNLRRENLKTVRPNQGHLALARLAEKKRVTVITQNVDGLHSVAGSPDVIELHGSLLRDRCNLCSKRFPAAERDTACTCGGSLRPDVVWFGEPLPEDALARAFEETESCDFFISAGTSGVVQPAASLPMIARENHAFTVEINTQPTALSPSMDEVLTGRSGRIMPEMVKLLEKE